jgi:hypothetical protein
MAADDFPPRTATPKDPSPAHPTGHSHSTAGSSESPRRTVGVYDRPEHTSSVSSLVIIGIIAVLIALALLWALGVFS